MLAREERQPGYPLLSFVYMPTRIRRDLNWTLLLLLLVVSESGWLLPRFSVRRLIHQYPRVVVETREHTDKTPRAEEVEVEDRETDSKAVFRKIHLDILKRDLVLVNCY
jgi:hypothetical protein